MSAPLRFEAAFPTSGVSKVQASVAVPGLALYTAWSFARGTTFSVEGIDESLMATSNTSSSFISNTPPIENGPPTTYFADGFKTVRSAVRCGAFRPRYIQKLTAAQSQAPWIAATDVLTLSTKPTYLCGISEVVSGHGLQWVVTGVAATQSTAEQFVDSFKPLVTSG